MKKFIYLFGFLWLPFATNSQTYFAPIGTQWVYGRYQFGPIPPTPPYAVVTVADTLTFKNRPCIHITGGGDCSTLPDSVFLYKKGGKIYCWKNGDTNFWLLYDFDAQPGSFYYTKSLWDTKDSLKVVIDALQSYSFNGKSYAAQKVHIEGNLGYEFGPFILKNIGSVGFIIASAGFCDPVLGGLTCFSFTPQKACVSGTTEAIKIDLNLSISPNPVQDILSVQVLDDSPQSKPYLLRLLTSEGRVFYTQSDNIYFNKNEARIPVSQLPSGLYYLQVQTEDGRRITSRFVKT